MAALGAQIVGEPELAAIRAFLVIDRLQRMMAAAHVALGRRCFSFGDSHCGTCFAKNKNCDDLRLSQRETPWRRPIIANRGPYSAWVLKRKRSRGQRPVADQGIGRPLVAKGRHRPVARDKGRLIAHRPKTLGDRVDQLLVIALGKVPTADRALEQHVADDCQM